MLSGTYVLAEDNDLALNQLQLEDDVDEQELLILRTLDRVLCDALALRLRLIHVQQRRVPAEQALDGVDFCRQRCAHQDGLNALGHRPRDVLQILLVAITQYQVGLVQNQMCQVVERQRAYAHILPRPRRCRNDDIRLRRQHCPLHILRHLVGQLHSLDVLGAECCQGLDGLVDLLGELAGRNENEDGCAGLRGLALPLLALEEGLEDWDQEGGALAAAGFASGEEVLAAEGNRDGLGLDWRRGVPALLCESLEETLVQVQGVPSCLDLAGFLRRLVLGIFDLVGLPLHDEDAFGDRYQ